MGAKNTVINQRFWIFETGINKFSFDKSIHHNPNFSTRILRLMD